MADNANHIGELDGALPLSDGSAGLGDDEIRTIKRVLLNDLTEINGQLQKPQDNNDPDGTQVPLDHLTINTWEKRIHALEQGTGGGPGPGAGFVVGMIIAWSGVSLPTGWVLCDGTNGTPDLRNRFILGSELNSYGAGGSDSGVTSPAGNHTHAIDIAQTTLTPAQVPAHTHYMFTGESVNGDKGNLIGDVQVARDAGNLGDSRAYKMQESTQTAFHGRTGETGGGSGHTHSASIPNAGEHTHTMAEKPAYFALAFIQYQG